MKNYKKERKTEMNKKTNANALTSDKLIKSKTICVCTPPETYYGSNEYTEASKNLTPSAFLVLQYYLTKIKVGIMTHEKEKCTEHANICKKSYDNGLDELFREKYIRAINEETYIIDYKNNRRIS